MPRPKLLPDAEVLERALAIMHGQGPEALTFSSLSGSTGLSPAALVQRFGTKSELKQRTLLHAWDALDRKTTALASETPRTPDGAIALLVALSSDYGGIESYAEGLLVLREDLRDPALRHRGALWKTALCRALDERLGSLDAGPEGLGLLMASQWQGSLLWWGFDPGEPLESHVERHLRSFVAALASPHPSKL